MKNEAPLQRLIIARVNSIPGCYCWRQNVGAVKTRAGFVRFGLVGQSDVSGILPNGRRLEIEVKSDRGQLTEEQRVFRDRIMASGGLHITARTLDDALGPILEAIK